MPGLPLAVSGLTLAFAGDTIIDVPALALRPGTLTVLSGPSGSGKSTLLYLLSGLLKPASGAIVWGDTDLATLSEARRDRWRLEHAGFIFQNFHLIEELSPLDNVVTPVWFSAFSARGQRHRAIGLLDELAVPHQRVRAALLSRGEQQRVAIARALLTDPQVIFADEPTASLDAKAGQTVIAALVRLAAEGRTVVTATHDPALLTHADILVSLTHGQKIAITRKELVA